EQVDARHVARIVPEVVVEQGEVELGLAQDDEGVRGGAAARDAVPRPLQAAAHEQGVVLVVLDEEKVQRLGRGAFGHHAPPARRAGGVRRKVRWAPLAAGAGRLPPQPSTGGRARKRPSDGGSNACSGHGGGGAGPSSRTRTTVPPAPASAPPST